MFFIQWKKKSQSSLPFSCDIVVRKVDIHNILTIKYIYICIFITSWMVCKSLLAPKFELCSDLVFIVEFCPEGLLGKSMLAFWWRSESTFIFFVSFLLTSFVHVPSVCWAVGMAIYTDWITGIDLTWLGSDWAFTLLNQDEMDPDQLCAGPNSVTYRESIWSEESVQIKVKRFWIDLKAIRA